jgi:two-component system nitrate/nitrite response regulator NarL
MEEPRFTPREIETLKYLQLGDTNKLIAHALGISECTVKIHIRSIMRKVHASNRTQAVIRARANLLGPEVQF